MGFFRRSLKDQERAKTRALFTRAQTLFQHSPTAKFDVSEDVVEIVCVILERNGYEIVDTPITRHLIGISHAFFAASELYDFPDSLPLDEDDMERAAAIRTMLARRVHLLENATALHDLTRLVVFNVLDAVVRDLPDQAFVLNDTGGQELHISATSALDDPVELIHFFTLYLFHADIADTQLFDDVRRMLSYNIAVASGIEDKSDTRRHIHPREMQGKEDPATIARLYLRDTPFDSLLDFTVPFVIPQKVRFEHTHVIGGSGHGKTQCLQHMILADIDHAQSEQQGFCVIDSQGDMIDTIAHLQAFAPGHPLANRFLLVDPNDIEHPPALNMFYVDQERLATFGAVEREKIINGSIELYEYIFGALLGADLTAKQGTIFKFLARLMLAIPGATIHTLRRVAQGDEDLTHYYQHLDPMTREFFQTQFFANTYKDTRTQVVNRLWAVLSNAIFERMFNAPINKVDLFDAMNSGKIVLINTAKDLLKKDGCAIFGRFFIAMIAQASLSRAAIHPSKRTPFFVYIDEAQDYFDDNIENLLNQARKYNVGLTFAHQNLGQLSQGLKASMLASTSIKMAGGVSAADAAVIAKDMRCDNELLLSMKKHQAHTEFATYIRNHTPTPVTLSVPLGALEQRERMDSATYRAMLENNRLQVALTPEEAAQTQHSASQNGQDVPDAAQTVVTSSGDMVDSRSPRVDASAATGTTKPPKKERKNKTQPSPQPPVTPAQEQRDKDDGDDVYAFEIGGAE